MQEADVLGLWDVGHIPALRPAGRRAAQCLQVSPKLPRIAFAWRKGKMISVSVEWLKRNNK